MTSSLTQHGDIHSFRKLLGRGFALSALIVATSSAAAPTLGGIILAFATWPWIFAINVPIGIVAIVVARGCVPHTPRRDERLDPWSTVLSVISLGFIVLGLDAVARHVAMPDVAALLGLGVTAGIFFLVRQQRIVHPLVALRLFRNRRFSLAAVTSFTAFLAQGLAFIALPFFLRETLHATPLHAGLLLSSWPLATIVSAPLAGYLSDRIAPPLTTTVGLALFSLGFALLAGVREGSAPATVILGCLVCGFGFGLFQAPNNRELLANVPRDRSGNAAGILATVRTLGQTLGAALVALYLGGAAFTVGTGAHVSLEGPLRGTLVLSAVLAWTAAFISSTRLALPSTAAVRRVETGTRAPDATRLQLSEIGPSGGFSREGRRLDGFGLGLRCGFGFRLAALRRAHSASSVDSEDCARDENVRATRRTFRLVAPGAGAGTARRSAWAVPSNLKASPTFEMDANGRPPA